MFELIAGLVMVAFMGIGISSAGIFIHKKIIERLPPHIRDRIQLKCYDTFLSDVYNMSRQTIGYLEFRRRFERLKFKHHVITTRPKPASEIPE